jgi:glutamate synthase domain-containing protein 1
MKEEMGIPRQGLYDPAHEHDACGVGFVANIAGEKSHGMIHKGIEVLVNLEHRGACGCDPETGDGAGILIQLPDRFLRKEAAKLDIELPEAGLHASGLVFLSRHYALRDEQSRKFEELVADEGQHFLGWREVPHDPDAIVLSRNQGFYRAVDE